MTRRLIRRASGCNGRRTAKTSVDRRFAPAPCARSEAPRGVPATLSEAHIDVSALIEREWRSDFVEALYPRHCVKCWHQNGRGRALSNGP